MSATDTQEICSVVLQLVDGTQVTDSDTGGIVIAGARASVVVDRPTPGLRDAIDALRRGATVQHIVDRVVHLDGRMQGITALALIRDCDVHGLLQHDLLIDGTSFASLWQGVHGSLPPASVASDADPIALSRFAYCRSAAGALVVESPFSGAQVTLHHWRAMAFVSRLAIRRTWRDAMSGVPGLGSEAARQLVSMLNAAAMLARADEDAQPADGGALAFWEFHDLLFHARSRFGRQLGGYGGTYRFRPSSAPASHVDPERDENTIELPTPDLASIASHEPSFTSVLEARRSIREYGERALTLPQLGELLYRSARVRPPRAGSPEAISSRPYPSAGGIYELETYIAIGRCIGLDEGLYHYQPGMHRLRRLTAAPQDVRALLVRARSSMGPSADLPQALVILAARFQRIQFKYEAMAYAAILKDAGILMQTMALVATAMGLAPCHLGGGDADCFARAAGTDYCVESSVAEMALGTLPEMKAAQAD